MPPARLQWKTRLFAAIVILSNTLGNFFIARGMRSLQVPADSPLRLIQAILTPWVALGVALLILWLLSRMALLSWADLSYVLPVTSLGYVANALMGHFFLGEHITLTRWGGTLLIVAGTMLVGNENARNAFPSFTISTLPMSTWILLSTVVGCTVLGDLLSSFEMKRHGEVQDFRPSGLGKLLVTLATRKLLILSVFFMAVSFFAFIKLMETADLSFAVPASAAAIVFETILARLILKESVDSRRWWGVCLVALGVILLAV